MNKQDLALNNLQGLICHKTQPTKTLFTTGVYIGLFKNSWSKVFSQDIVKKSLITFLFQCTMSVFILFISVCIVNYCIVNNFSWVKKEINDVC